MHAKERERYSRSREGERKETEIDVGASLAGRQQASCGLVSSQTSGGQAATRLQTGGSQAAGKTQAGSIKATSRQKTGRSRAKGSQAAGSSSKAAGRQQEVRQ